MDPRGKPFLKDRACHFSLTHTGRWLGFVLSPDAPVGMDLERERKRDVLSLAAHFFSPEEEKWLSEGADDERLVRFYKVWTQKEAFVKARGTGLAGNLSRFTMPCTEAGLFDEPYDLISFSPAPGISGAVAFNRPGRRPMGK